MDLKKRVVTCALGILAGCTPVARESSLVIGHAGAPGPTSVVVQGGDDLAPGDAVEIWREYRSCGVHRGCRRYRHVGIGVVTTVILDGSGTAVVLVDPGTRVAIGDRAFKRSPMQPWHFDEPVE